MNLMYVNGLARAAYMINDQKQYCLKEEEYYLQLRSIVQKLKKKKNLFLVWIVHFQHLQFHLLLIEVIWGQRAQLFQRGKLSFRGVKGFTQDHQTCQCQWLRFWSRCTRRHHTSQSYWKVKLLNKCKGYREWKYSLELVKTNKEILTNHSSQDQNCLIFKIRFFKCQFHC